MQIVEIASGKVGTLESFSTSFKTLYIYEFENKLKVGKLCGEYELYLEDVSDKYRIVSDVKSRQEIEDKIKDLKETIEELENEMGNAIYYEYQLDILNWLLEESE